MNKHGVFVWKMLVSVPQPIQFFLLLRKWKECEHYEGCSVKANKGRGLCGCLFMLYAAMLISA